MRKIGLVMFVLLLLSLSSFASADGILGGKLFATGGDVTVTVMDASAGYTSTLWLASPESVEIGTNRDVGTAVNLGSFTSGIELVFMLVDPEGSFYTGTTSADGLYHAVVSWVDDNTASVGFEDLYDGGDLDYDDCIFLFDGGIASTPATPTTATPEPATMLLLGVGLVGLAGVARKKMK